jgi:hypothetical protein
MGTFSVKQPYGGEAIDCGLHSLNHRLRKENLLMKRNQTLFPMRHGRGTQKVSLYVPSTEGVQNVSAAHVVFK